MGEELNNVNIEEESPKIESEEIVEIVEISASEPIAIDSQEAFPALGEDNENLNHAILYGRDRLNQHPITSITGLRKELNVIESLQTVYSDKKQQANYYMWQNENPLQENCEGYFVSICLGTDKIEKCNGQTDVFGVTVAEAGFIGNQAYEEINNEDEAIIKIKKDRDNKYGLVVTAGIVGVRCESDVTAGNYVVSNQDGIAKKVNDNCGYLVTAISNDNGVQYAMISLSTPSTWTQSLTNELQGLDKRVKNAERNIVSATNIANSAYKIAKNVTDVDIEDIKNKVNEALNEVNENADIVGNLSNLVNNASKTAVQAKAIAESAVNSAEIIRSEAVAKATEALADVNNLISDVAPITSWKDPNSENTGASYFVEHIQNDLATKTEVETAETNSQHALAATQKNAAEIQSLIASIDKYSIGEYSQSYGLTLEQAKSILKQDIVYIPTVDHNESDSIPILGNGIDDISTEKFLRGYAYTWADEGWSISKAQSVAFSGEYVAGGAANPYWVVINQDVVEDGTTYDLGGLYKWENDAWIKVALVLDNSISRAVSSIRQTSNEIAAEVVSARGDAASLNLRIQDNETTVQSIASWKDEVSNDVSKIATIEQKANDNSASISLVVAEENGEKVINAASIVTAINDSGDSSIALKADYINLTGYVSANNGFIINKDGYMTANGANITGKITATSGTFNNCTITDSCTIEGDIIASGVKVLTTADTLLLDATNNSVKIANFYCTENSFFANASGSSTWSSNGVFMCTGTESSWSIGGSESINGWCFGAGGNFGVTKAGALYCTDAHITGVIKATEGIVGGWNMDKTKLWTGNMNTASGRIFLSPNIGSTYTICGVSASDWVFGAGETFGIRKDGSLYTTKAVIDGDSIIKSGIKLANENVTLTTYDTTNETGINITIQDTVSWIIMSRDAVFLNAQNSTTSHSGSLFLGTPIMSGYEAILSVKDGLLQGSWYLNSSSVAITSDINKKNNITQIDDKYDSFFDNLIGCTFKYNDGTSNRLHVGFIAQRVKDALDIANIDTNDFAGLVIKNNPDNTEDWFLRYEEFIALNTWQIQKLKAEVKQLKQEIDFLKI